MSHVVKCRLCKEQFDTDKIPREDWTLVGQRSYYHTSCYNDWVKGKQSVKSDVTDAEFWRESLVDYLYRDIKMTIDFSKLDSQWKNFTKPEKKMTPKGIYFAVRYYYDVLKGNPEKAQGGIGIVQSIYGDSAQYWVDLENKKSGTLEAIVEQIKQREARPVQYIQKTTKVTKPKEKWSLDSIEGE